MANHKSAIKRIRSDETKKLRNKYYLKTGRTYIKKLKNSKSKKEATNLLNLTYSIIDKLKKRKIIHKNKASNLKSKISKHYNKATLS